MTDQGETLVLERTIAAPPSLVYSELTDPAELRQWLGPHDCTVTVLEDASGPHSVGPLHAPRVTVPMTATAARSRRRMEPR